MPQMSRWHLQTFLFQHSRESQQVLEYQVLKYALLASKSNKCHDRSKKLQNPKKEILWLTFCQYGAVYCPYSTHFLFLLFSYLAFASVLTTVSVADLFDGQVVLDLV